MGSGNENGNGNGIADGVLGISLDEEFGISGAGGEKLMFNQEVPGMGVEPLKKDEASGGGTGKDDSTPPPKKDDEGKEGKDGSEAPGGGDGSKPASVAKDAETRSTEVEYGTILKDLYERGLIDNPEEIHFTDEDGKELSITGENFCDALETMIKAKSEEAMKGRTDVSGVSEFTKSLIDIESHGGNIHQLLEYYRMIQAPVRDVDIDTEAGQVRLISHYYKVNNRLTEENIDIIISDMRKKGTLKDAAESVKEAFERDEAEKLEGAKKATEENAKKQRAYMEDYTRRFEGSLKEQFELTDQKRRSLRDFAVKADKEGVFEINKALNEWLRDPAKATELAYFLYDREGYLNQISNKKVSDTKRNIYKSMTLAKKDRSDGNSGEKGKPGGEAIIELSD
jgi:hypothetical protein